MWFEYWMVLFTLSCFANILGLNISASFNSVKVIYILIPIFIIPQLLFSGVIVKFDKLNPVFGDESSVPLIGNVMASRWAYEALAVTQFKDNSYNEIYYEYYKNKSFATWKKDYWLQELNAKLDYVKTNIENPDAIGKTDTALLVLRNEIEREHNFIQNVQCENCIETLTLDAYTENTYSNVKTYFDILKGHYKSVVDTNKRRIDAKNTEIVEKYGRDTYLELVDENTNEALNQFSTNKTDLTKLVEVDGYLIQKSDPIYLDPYDKSFWGAHFYAPRKRIAMLNTYVPTFWANICVMWLMSILLIVTLYFDAFKKLMDGIEKLFSKISFKKSR